MDETKLGQPQRPHCRVQCVLQSTAEGQPGAVLGSVGFTDFNKVIFFLYKATLENKD